MDPALAAIVAVLAVLAATGVIAYSMRTVSRFEGKDRLLAQERGLAPGDVERLEHLASLLPETRLSDLLISPVRYNVAVTYYVERLPRDDRYARVISELTRLRRKVHPPGSVVRLLHCTRELAEGTEVTLICPPDGARRAAVVWGVDEDRIEVRLGHDADLRGLAMGHSVTVELFRAGQGLYRFEARIRSTGREPRPRADLEHTSDVQLENRREHLREHAALAVRVTVRTGPPVEATLEDLSGGGLAFYSRAPIAVGSRVAVTVELADEDAPPLQAEVTVLRADRQDDGRWHHHGRFEDLSDETREAIIRFVFALQRRRIRALRVV